MASLINFLESITEEQTNLILREMQAMSRPDYGDACLKARVSAAQTRKGTWSIYSMAHVNALLLGLGRIKYAQSYDVARLISTVECFAYGLMGQGGLNYEEYNLAIGPVASVLSPELFAEEQTWAIERVEPVKYVRPYRPPSYRTRKVKPNPEIDVRALVDQLVKEAGKVAPAPSIPFVENEAESPLNAMLRGIQH